MRRPQNAAGVIALGLVIAAGLSACASDDKEPAATSTGTHVVDGISYPVPEKTSIKYGLASQGTVGYLPLLYAQDQKLFEKYGLSVEFVVFGGAAQLSQAMLAGQVDAQDQTGGPVLASLKTPNPQEMVYVSRYNLTDILFTNEKVTSAADLKGKAIAVSSFGSQSYAGALIALRSLGLSAKDVTITPVGNDQARLAALRSGSVAASVQDGASLPTLEPLGFHPLVKLADVQGQGGVVRSAATVTVKFAKQYPNTVLAFVAAYMEAQVKMDDDADLAARLFADNAKMPLDQAKQEVAAALAEKWLPVGGTCPDQSLADFQKEVFKAANPSLADVDSMAACTNQFVDQLKQLGLQAKLGI